MKKISRLLIATMVLTMILGGCAKPAGFDQSKAITVVSREEGSGTRGAFIELLGIEQKDASGKEVDYTTELAIISNSTSVVMSNVNGNVYAIGYISLGSLNDTVKALSVDGVLASAANIKAGNYKVARPFNVATKGEISELAQDFLAFILSADGQAVVEANGYISLSNTGAFTSSMTSGKLVVGGSSSVSPIMEKLKEAYLKVNTNATIEVQQTDSTSGMTGAIDGVLDIGMASRDLKESELSAGLVNQVIAMDGIAIIVNNENPLDAITTEDVRAVYMGELTNWSSLFK